MKACNFLKRTSFTISMLAAFCTVCYVLFLLKNVDWEDSHLHLRIWLSAVLPPVIVSAITKYCDLFALSSGCTHQIELGDLNYRSVPPLGLEPRTSDLKGRSSNQLSYRGMLPSFRLSLSKLRPIKVVYGSFILA